MFVFIKKIFYIGSLFLSSLVSTTPLSCISIKEQECEVRPEIIDFNSNNPIFYLFSIKINKCGGTCNIINNPYANICAPDVIKDLNVRVFNLMSRTNEARFTKWHENCKCICRLGGIICNSKQRWNENKCRCEFKELIDKGTCDKGFVWNPSNCECECDKNCNIGESVDYENCKCRKKLADKLIDECAETIDETKLVNLNKNKYECGSCIVYIVLMIVVIVISTGITVYLVNYNWSLVKNNTHKETVIW